MINQKISGTQISILAFLSSVSFIASMPGSGLQYNFYDGVLSALISCVVGLLLSLPLLLVHGNLSFQEAGRQFYLPTASVCGLYVLYFLYTTVWDITSFAFMLKNTIYPDLPILTMLIAVLAVCAYGASKGVETIGRSGVFVLVAFLLGLAILIWGGVFLADFGKLRVFFQDGYQGVFQNVVPIFSGSTFLPQAVILFSFAQGRTRGPYIGWNIASGFLLALILFAIQLCLGEYASTQEYPVYALSAASVLLPLQRLDIICNIIWFMVTVLSITVRLFVATACAEVVLPPRSDKWVRICFCIVVGGISYYLLKHPSVWAAMQSYWLSAVLAVILGGIAPLLLLCVHKVIKGKCKKTA